MKKKGNKKTYIKEQIQAKDYSFLIDYFEKLDSMKSFFYEIKSKKQDELTFSDISSIAEYYHSISVDLNDLENIRNILVTKQAQKISLILGISGLLSIIGPALPILTLGAIMSLIGTKQDVPLKSLKELIKEFNNYNDVILNYSGLISEYESYNASKKHLLRSSYLEIIALLSTLEPKSQEKYLQQLQDNCCKCKNKPWQLLLKLRELRGIVYEDSLGHFPNPYFIITSLIDHLKNLEEIDNEIIGDILYHISSLAEPDIENYSIELAFSLIHIITESVAKEYSATTELSIKELISSKLDQIDYNLNHYLVKALNAMSEEPCIPLDYPNKKELVIKYLEQLIFSRDPLKKELAII